MEPQSELRQSKTEEKKREVKLSEVLGREEQIKREWKRMRVRHRAVPTNSLGEEKGRPRPLQEVPKSPQDAPETAPTRPKGSPRGSKRDPRSPRTHPRQPKTDPNGPKKVPRGPRTLEQHHAGLTLIQTIIEVEYI